MNGVNANPHTQVEKEETGIWHKRLRLRKTSFSDQNTVKEENNVTTCEEKATGESKKRALNTFTCSTCNDGISFKPGELITHFKVIHGGEGNPPMFPCSMCDFSTSVFITLQKHRMKHKDCLFTCDSCEDDVQQTLPQLIKHIQTHHSLDGQFYCTKCKLSMQEIEQFVCHSCPQPVKSKHEESITNGVKLETPQKNDLLQHMAAACRRKWSRRNWWKKRESSSKEENNNLSQELKLLHPKPEPKWPSTLLDTNGILVDPEKTLEETKQFLERTVVSGKKWSMSLKDEQDFAPPHLNGINHWRVGKDKISGLMEKNNITVPPDCTTKVVGFKMVDGKKHLVLRVIPSDKQDEAFRSNTVKPTNQSSVEPNDTVKASGNCSQGTPERILSPGRCATQHSISSSVIERCNSQQQDVYDNRDFNNLQHNPVRKTKTTNLRSCDEINTHAEHPKEQEKPLSGSEQNSNEDLSSDVGSAQEKRDLALDPNADLCSTFGFDCISPSLNNLSESLCGFQSADGGLLFHSESTNNCDPREAAVFPVGQYDCERENLCVSELNQTVEELPLTTVRHLLDESSSSDEPQRDSACTGGTIERHEPENTSIIFSEDSDSSTTVPESAAGSISSLNRKRMGEESSTDSQQQPVSKSPKPSILHWEPASRDTPTTLRLIPFNSTQSLKIPAENQPVIVLNHPDSDIPEVTNIMKVVHKHKAAIQRVVLSRKTLRALSEFNCNAFISTNLLTSYHYRREWPNSSVKERFSLKLRLKRVRGRKYTVVPTLSESAVLQPTFTCWFCGRVFRNQEAWVGHGQRHLTEATRGWKQIFNT
nr:zinc finger protein 518A [Danio rerio]|eukprot:XP_017214356.1 zinc finger protein 518A [Danio rerio]